MEELLAATLELQERELLTPAIPRCVSAPQPALHEVLDRLLRLQHAHQQALGVVEARGAAAPDEPLGVVVQRGVDLDAPRPDGLPDGHTWRGRRSAHQCGLALRPTAAKAGGAEAAGLGEAHTCVNAELAAHGERLQ